MSMTKGTPASSQIVWLEGEITRLRCEVERLTQERDYWARARNEWEKSAGLLEEENKRLTRELAYMTVQRDQWRGTCASHASRAEAAERERDWHKSLTQSHDLLADNAAQKTRADAAEAKVAKLREALYPFTAPSSHYYEDFKDHETLRVQLPAGWVRRARTALQETEQ